MWVFIIFIIAYLLVPKEKRNNSGAYFRPLSTGGSVGADMAGYLLYLSLGVLLISWLFHIPLQ